MFSTEYSDQTYTVSGDILDGVSKVNLMKYLS